MKKTSFNKITAWLTVLCMLVSLLVAVGMPTAVYAADVPWTGSGTEADPYLIYTADDLAALSEPLNEAYLSSHFLQMEDIDLSDTVWGKVYAQENSTRGWVSIGDDNPFTGSFDGNGKTISGLFIEQPEMENVGLFGYSENATFEDVRLDGVEVKGGLSVGGLIGYAFESDIFNSYADGSVTGTMGVGGLVGFNDSGTISGSHTTATVTGVVEGGEEGSDSIGGLMGSNFNGTITDSYATGTVTGYMIVGGLVGNHVGGTITDSYATGDVSCVRGDAGGLVGSNDGDGKISGSYATGKVEAIEDDEGEIDGDRIGGLVGMNWSGEITKSYAAGDVKGLWSVGGLVGDNLDKISESCAMGDVEGVRGDGYNGVGGLVGTNQGEIINAYATGGVTGTDNVGGLVGLNQSDGTIENTYAAGSVTGTGENAGGLVGQNDSGTVGGSYYDIETTNQPDNGYGTPKSTTDMMRQTTFEGWDFDNIWGIQENAAYLYFGWQFTPPPLTINTVNPTDNATGVAIDKTITITFNNTIQNVLQDEDITIVYGHGIEVPIQVSISGSTLTLTHQSSLAYHTEYTVTIPTGAVEDINGSTLAADYSFSFTTRNRPSGGGGGGTTALVIGKVNPPDGTLGTTYTHIFTASGGSKPYKFEVTDGTLPEGLNLAEDGTLSGTPTAAGTYNYTVTMFDRAGRTSSYTFSLIINEGSPSRLRMIILTIDSLEAVVNGQPYTLDAAPFIKPGVDRALVPIRFVSEAMGAEVVWVSDTRQVIIKDAGKEIVLTIDSRDVLLGGQLTVIDCSPMVNSPGRTFVPLRFVSETLGAVVDYEDGTRKITITW